MMKSWKERSMRYPHATSEMLYNEHKYESDTPPPAALDTLSQQCFPSPVVLCMLSDSSLKYSVGMAYIKIP